ncbi:MAG: hypothetical protein HUJ71_03665 [Pseudobutyrivibrio sp.]|nr:hypothetical protein [Pseudobutyrivibrio sp.]
MKVWKLNFELDNYDNLISIPPFSIEDINELDGRRLLGKWQTRKVVRMEPEKNLPLGDAPGFTIPVFSERALCYLRELIRENIEELPLECSENNYYAINVINVLDAIDYQKSEYKTYRDGKRIMLFIKYCFKEDIVKDVSIFKIVDERRRSIFVSDQFKKIVEYNNLKGFKFELAWDSDNE